MNIPLSVDEFALVNVASQLDLREPNAKALATLAQAAEIHTSHGLEATYEGVIEVATGVGKTYILAGCIEYFAQLGIRNFAIITPGKTILNKTIANFSVGNPKSLREGMASNLYLVTADNFADGATLEAMDDPTKVKLYIFTVQALLNSTSQTSRKTRTFQETLGGPFYQRLQEADDLFVLADEHHIYEGEKFSAAVRDLEPRFLFGFTATPAKGAPVIYRYPLSQAIADKLVKKPVIVGRKDDRTDALTKLTDGVLLLDWKTNLMERYCEQRQLPVVNPVMLVIAEDITKAEEYAEICQRPDFFEGRYAGKVLVVHSRSSDEALAELEQVDSPESTTRILVNCMLLKEGWDNKQVYVIAAMRASVSEVLREQTLGRGLRLPFGHYSDWESLNTLEVVAHERYEELLRKANVMREELVDYRAQLVERDIVVSEPVLLPVQLASGTSPSANPEGLPTTDISGEAALNSDDQVAGVVVTDMGERVATIQETMRPTSLMAPRQDLGVLRVPRLRQEHVTTQFHLADIWPLKPFRSAGEELAVMPEEELRRTALSARVNQELGFVQLMAEQLQEQLTFTSPGELVPLAQSRELLADLVMVSDIVPTRADERQALQRILDEFILGLGSQAERVLSANLQRAARRVIEVIEREYAKSRGKIEINDVVVFIEFNKSIEARNDFSTNPREAFKKWQAYEGWKKSLYPQVWFDSEPERDVALILDDEPEIKLWLRLQKNYLTILWGGMDNWYNPDFVAVETNGTHWVVEVKAERDMETVVVQKKQEAAEKWANHASSKTETPWHYLLVSQPQVKQVKGSWAALRQLANVV